MKILKCLPLLACLTFSLLCGLAQATESGPAIPLPDEDRAAIEKYLGKGVVGNAIPPPSIIDTSRYLAAKPGIRKFRLVSGPDAGKTERHLVTRLKQEAGTTSWRYDVGGKFIYFVIAKANGDYVLTGVTDTEEGAITRYSPYEPFMLQGLAPGEERNVNLGVKVFDLSDPDDLSYEGALDVNYRYVGAYKVKVPAGSFDAVLMKWTFKGKVGPASVDDTQYRFFAPDSGIVAAVEQLDVSAMLIYNLHMKVAKVLVAKPK
jgi:hypothetical protein